MSHHKLPPEEFDLEVMTMLAMSPRPDSLEGIPPHMATIAYENKIAWNRLMIALAVRAVAK